MSLRPRRTAPAWWPGSAVRLVPAVRPVPDAGEPRPGARARAARAASGARAPRAWAVGEVDPLGFLARGVVGAALPLLWRVRTTGAEELPADGPAVLAPNHRGLLDGPLLWARVWAARRRPVAFLVKEEMFTGVLGVLLRATGQIPVDRRSGARALVTATGVLERGGVVGVFPEGTRGDGGVQSVREGVAWLALRTGAPVVPVAMTGTRPADDPARRSMGPLPALGSHLGVHLGRSLTLTEARTDPMAETAQHRPGSGWRPARRAALAEATEAVRTAMAAHVRDASAPAPTDLETP